MFVLPTCSACYSFDANPSCLKCRPPRTPSSLVAERQAAELKASEEHAINLEVARTAAIRRFPWVCEEEHPVWTRQPNGKACLTTFKSTFGSWRDPLTGIEHDGPYRVWNDERIPPPCFPGESKHYAGVGPRREDASGIGRSAEQRAAWYRDILEDMKSGKDDVVEQIQAKEFESDLTLGAVMRPCPPASVAAIALEKQMWVEIGRLKSSRR